jgi:hypothetical protein
LERARAELEVFPEVEQFLSFIEAGGRGTTTQRRITPRREENEEPQ